MKRKEADIKTTWDISLIYKTKEDYENALLEYKRCVDKFVEDYKGKINAAELVEKSLRDLEYIYKIISKVDSYASLPVEADTLDENLENIYIEMLNICNEYNSKLSFYENELLKLDKEILEKFKEKEDFKVYIEDLLLKKEHLLSDDVELVLNQLSSSLNFPYKLYGDTKFKDIKFDNFEVNGKEYDLSYNKFEGVYEYEEDKDLRREAFARFSKEIAKYQNTTASAYNAHVKTEKTISELRGYNSVIDYLLEEQKVSRELYNRQIDLIMQYLAPHMRKYAEILKKIHKLDEIRYSDLKIEVDPNFNAKINFDEAKKYINDGLSVLGEEYISIIKEAFENRWIDYANNDGKSTGAFAATPYGTASFVLTTFNENMYDVMTLAHELGHVGHFQLAHKNQSIFNSEPSMYFVESPSTTNELIVENYLLKLADEKNDKKMKRWILSQIVSKTYYHNFITHLLEAHYQREVYKLVDDKKEFNAGILNKIFKESLEKFWGEEVILDEGAELTWMRQPHYYMGLYPYTYSAGLTIGTQVAIKIHEDESVANKWKEALKAGGTKTPVEFAKMVDVDITTDKPLMDTIAYIGSIIDEIEELSIELGDID